MLSARQKLLVHAKQSAIDALETTSKRTIQKTAEATDDLIGNKITNKVIKYLPPYNSRTDSQTIYNTNTITITIPIYIYIYPEKIQQIIDDLRLI